jgi:hypothetical protein
MVAIRNMLYIKKWCIVRPIFYDVPWSLLEAVWTGVGEDAGKKELSYTVGGNVD